MYYAYYRVSTLSQVEKNGIDMQVAVIGDYCRQNDIQIEEEFQDEGISGTVADRDGLADLLSVLSCGDKVIVQNTSRLWRNETVSYLVKHAMKKVGADIISVEQPTFSVNCTDANDFLVNGIFTLLDEWDRLTINTKLAKGRRAKAQKGNKPCGTAPIGYTWEDNEIIIDYNNNAVVRDIFEKYVKVQSLQKLLDYCEKKGYRTTRGNKFSKASLKRILNNDFYIGYVTYGNKKIKGNQPVFLNERLFIRANEILAR